MTRHTVTAAAVAAVAAAALVAAPSPAQAAMDHDHGSERHMYVLPGPASTSDAQRRYAERLLARARRQGRHWATRRQARRDGYRPIGTKPDSAKLVYHYNSAARIDDGHRLDARRPESLMYWNRGPGDVVLVGLMFRIPSSGPFPHPAGALMNWHVHFRCQMAEMLPADAMQGPCPDDERMRTGPTAMAHVWFTDDVDHAFGLYRPPTEMLHPLPAD
jgi:hypothetical protein